MAVYRVVYDISMAANCLGLVCTGKYKMSVVVFPKIHNYLLCPKCECSSWHISWPKNRELEWYVECMECSQQYTQGLITGLKTPDEETHK